MTIVLSKTDILRLIGQQPPLIRDYIALEDQLQPNGFDLTVREVAAIDSAGQIGTTNAGRIISRLRPLEFGADGFVDLKPGAYGIIFNEIVSLPTNAMAFAFPRSSLLRCGVTVQNAVWDAGYSGRSQALLVVHNPAGFRLQKNARVNQLVFIELSGKTEGYRGIYQGENI